MNALLQLIFPAQSRRFPYQRLILDLLRSAHILCVCLLLGGLYFRPDAPQLGYWLVGVLATGAGLLAIEVHRTAAVLFELRGIIVLCKLALLFYLPQFSPATQLILLMLLVFFSTLSSHSPRRIRHLSVMPLAWRARLNIAESAKDKSKT